MNNSSVNKRMRFNTDREKTVYSGETLLGNAYMIASEQS